MSNQEIKSAPRRLLDDRSRPHPDAPSQLFGQALHPAYTHWVASGFHRRDFESAVDHHASLMLIDYFMHEHAGSLDQLLDSLPQEQLVEPLAVPGKRRDAAQTRFYDELCDIAPEIDTSRIERAVRFLFGQWLRQGWLAGDFPAMATGAAKVLIYDHECAMSLGGLGGGKTGEQFLSTPYRG